MNSYCRLVFGNKFQLYVLTELSGIANIEQSKKNVNFPSSLITDNKQCLGQKSNQRKRRKGKLPKYGPRGSAKIYMSRDVLWIWSPKFLNLFMKNHSQFVKEKSVRENPFCLPIDSSRNWLKLRLIFARIIASIYSSNNLKDVMWTLKNWLKINSILIIYGIFEDNCKLRKF